MSARGAGARPPRGRRPVGADTRADIVSAARTAFAQAGYEATSLREIARRAGVEPALVHHYFGGKAALFAETMQIRLDPAAVVQRIVDGDPALVGERAVRSFSGVWDSPEQRPLFTAMIRSALTHEAAARALRRAGLAAAQMMGLVIMRCALPWDAPSWGALS